MGNRKKTRVDAQAPAPRKSSRFRRIVYPALFLTTLLVYAPVLGFDFVNFDDSVYVFENPHVLRGLTADGVSWAFTSADATAYWIPLTRLSHMLDVKLFGLNRGLHHFTNLLIHALAALLLFAFLDLATLALRPLRRVWNKGLVLEKLPFFALSGIAAVITFHAQQSGGAVRTTETFPVGLRIGNALVSYATYFSQMFWPKGLAVFYRYPSSIPVWKPLLAVALSVLPRPVPGE
jgi:hypothetical protein